MGLDCTCFIQKSSFNQKRRHCHDEVDKASTTDDFSVSDNPCPSDECWNYDDATKKCLLKSDISKCAILQCGGRDMSVIFTKSLFGRETGIASITPEPIIHGDDGYFVQCQLGKCGMKHFVENNK